jgi:3-phenylpropionate/trans-cinnamate dioxygenase ferredoxin reductase subunit
MSERAVIVGSGHAGVRFCEAMREHGFSGSLTMIGEDAHRPYERPPLSKDVLCGEADPGDHGLLTEEQQRALAIDWRGNCRADFVDRTTRRLYLADGTVVPYERLVLATGVKPRRLDCPGSDKAGIFYLADADHALRLRTALAPAGQSVVVIGGGFIGLEVAAAARRQGHGVTVVEGTARCAGRLFPPSLSKELTHLHQRSGVNIRTGDSVAEIVGSDRTTAVRLVSGEMLPADLVVIGIGSRPQTELAESCGLAVDNGILVDATGRTSDPFIYAVGDVAALKGPGDAPAQRRESWDNAQVMAQRAAAAVMNAQQPDHAPPWFWTDQYDCNIQFIGEVSDDSDEWCVERGAGRIYLYARRGELVAAGLVNAGRERRRLLKAVSNREPINTVVAMFGASTLTLAS